MTLCVRYSKYLFKLELYSPVDEKDTNKIDVTSDVFMFLFEVFAIQP